MEKEFPNTICRVCLCESKELKPISAKIEGETRSILEALNFVVNIDISVNNELPNKLCSDCEATLYKADAFKHRCLESEMILCQDFENKDKRVIESFLKSSTANTSLKQSSDPSADLTKSLHVFPINKQYEENNINVSKAKKTKRCNTGDIILNSVKDEEESVFDDYDDIPFVCDGEVKSEILMMPSPEPLDDRTEIKPKKSKVYKKNAIKKVKKPKANKNSLEKKSDKKFQCEICLKYFLRLSALKQHTISHTDEKPRICPFCGKSFKQGLSQHMKRHQGQKPYKCEICDKSFVMPSELKKHRNRFHKKDRPFVCAECGEGFSATSNLYSHQRRRHTGERRHACDLCPKRFFESNDLTKHMLTHTGEKPYPCPHCGRAFARKHHLTTHLKQHRDKLRPHTDSKIDET